MKCWVCEGSGMQICARCEGQGECRYCKGEGKGPCFLCDGSGEEPHSDSFNQKEWAKVPEPVRKIVEAHVASRLPRKILAKLRDLHARGLSISSDPAFFHFGGGMTVRNLCRQRLGDRDLEDYFRFAGYWLGDWDHCYLGVVAAIAETPIRQAPVRLPQPQQLQFSFIEPLSRGE